MKCLNKKKEESKLTIEKFSIYADFRVLQLLKYFVNKKGEIFMHGILNPEGPVMSFITKITYSAYLNLLDRKSVV